MAEPINITSERVDDLVLLLHVMMQMRLPETLNQHLPRHWKQEGLDLGWVAAIWLCYIVSQGDHRKVWVQEWVEQRRYTIEQVWFYRILWSSCFPGLRPFMEEAINRLCNQLS